MALKMAIFFLGAFAVSNAALVHTEPEDFMIKGITRQIISEEDCSFEDLEGLDSSPNDVREKFAEIYGKTPDGLAVNSEGYYSAVSPPITEQYGYTCTKVVGDPSFTPTGSTVENVLLLQKTVRNFGYSEITSKVGLERTWVESVEASISFTAGFTFSFTAGVEGIASAGHEFSFSITKGKTEKTESRDTISSSDDITIPGKSKVFVTSYAVVRKDKLDYTLPLSIHGHFGANFPDRVRPVDGSTDTEAYFWFQPVSNILPKTDGIASGEVLDAHRIDFKTEVGAAEPLTAEDIAEGPGPFDLD